MTNNYMIGDSDFVKGLKSKAIILAGIGAVGTALAYVASDIHHFMASYLLAFVYFLGISVTAIFFSALQFLVRAGWSASVRRIAEFFTGFVPYLAIGFIPIVIDILTGHSTLYHWAHHTDDVINDPVLKAKSAYLNQTFFFIRLALYYLVWMWMRSFIVGNSYKQDEMGHDYTPTKKNMKRSAPFIIMYALTITFAGFDLMMSVEPHWFSTMFGVYFFAGNFVSTIAMLTIFTAILYRAGHLKGFVTPEHFHDLGKLLFAFTVFWMYISFSQYFLIWYANMPEETEYFIGRTHTSWQWIGWALLFIHFILPFAILLQQKVKRNLSVLIATSVIILVMHLIDLSWVVLPVFSEHIFFAWQVIPLFLLFLGAFLFATAQQFAKKSMIAYNDPYIEESVELVS